MTLPRYIAFERESPDRLGDLLAKWRADIHGILQHGITFKDNVLCDVVNVRYAGRYQPVRIGLNKIKGAPAGVIALKVAPVKTSLVGVGGSSFSTTTTTSSSSSSTTYGTLWRWDEAQVTEFTSVVGSGATLSVSTQTGDGKDAAINVATGTTAGAALWAWTINDFEVSPHHWMRCAVDTASNANIRAGLLFYYVDASNWCAYTKGGNTANGVFLRYNNGTMQTRAATPALGTEGASNDLSYLQLTLEGKLPTASTDPGLRGHIGGPAYAPAATSSYINATDYGATWDAAWQQGITGFKAGFFVQGLAAFGASVNVKFSQLAVMAHPSAVDTSSTASTAVYTETVTTLTPSDKFQTCGRVEWSYSNGELLIHNIDGTDSDTQYDATLLILAG